MLCFRAVRCSFPHNSSSVRCSFFVQCFFWARCSFPGSADVLFRTTLPLYDALSSYNAFSEHDALFPAVRCSFPHLQCFFDAPPVQSSFCALFFVSLFFFHATFLLYDALSRYNACSVHGTLFPCSATLFSALTMLFCTMLLSVQSSFVRYSFSCAVRCSFFHATLLLYESLPSYNALCTMPFSVQCYVLFGTYNAFFYDAPLRAIFLCAIFIFLCGVLFPHNSFSARSSFFVQCLVHGSLFPCSAMLFSARLFFRAFTSSCSCPALAGVAAVSISCMLRWCFPMLSVR
jgi:hypothetical protein